MTNGYRHDLHGMNEQAPEENPPPHRCWPDGWSPGCFECQDLYAQEQDRLARYDDYNVFEENQLALDHDLEPDDWFSYEEEGY